MEVREVPVCDHDNVEHVSMNPLQKSDRTVQFKCKTCRSDVIKSIVTDTSFIKLFKRRHKLCVDHEKDREFIPVVKQDDGSTACNWCGEVLSTIVS